MSIAETVEPSQYLAYQNGRAAFLLSELLSGEASKFVQFEARTWLAQHESWLSDADDIDADPWDYTGEDDDEDDADQINDDRPGSKVLYSEGWI